VHSSRTIDRLIYIVVVVGPIMNVPQLYKIWAHKDATGVSAVSWIGFSVGSLLWIVYGVAHKDKPIIIMNVALMIIQALIAVGTVLYG
jgi:uncharacterized protein with PQ loop repeat